MKSLIWLFITLYLNVSLGYRFLEDEAFRELQFPPNYKVSGEKILVGSQIIVPFKEWCSSKYNKSRIDYYGGMVKRFYYSQEGKAFEIHPITNQHVTNKMVCYETEDEGEKKDFLPSPVGYVFIADEQANGHNATKWLKTSFHSSGYKTEETVWVFFNTKTGYAIPLRYEYKEINIWLGKSYAYTIVNYFDLELNVESGDFDLQGYECQFIKTRNGDLSTLAFVEPDKSEHVNSVFTQASFPICTMECVKGCNDISLQDQTIKLTRERITDDSSSSTLHAVECMELMLRFKAKHKRRYESWSEHEIRKTIFRRNLEKVLTTNHRKLGYSLALNKFADRTEKELHYYMTLKHDTDDLGAVPFPYNEDTIRELVSKLPEEYDMRLANLITPVQNQLACGSCWAFVTVATIEGAYAKSNGGWVVKLSEQALVDCAWGFFGKGCHGGKLSQAFAYARDLGVSTSEEYGEYLAMEGYCHTKNMTMVLKIKEFIEMKSFSEDDLKVVLYKHGSVAVKVKVHDDLKLYSGGVFYDANCKKLDTTPDHALTVVGYGKRNNETYWIAKNSWGQDWGFGGYILMSVKNNNCIIQPVAYYVTI